MPRPCFRPAFRGIPSTSATTRSISEIFADDGEAYFRELEVDTDLIEQRIYERQALLCRYRYLLARARELGLHTVLSRYQPMGG